MLSFVLFCGESIATEWVSGNTSPRTLTTNVSVPCGEEKRVCHLLVHLGTLTSTTRTTGDLLTLLCLFFINIIVHTLIHKYQSYDTFQERPRGLLQAPSNACTREVKRSLHTGMTTAIAPTRCQDHILETQSAASDTVLLCYVAVGGGRRLFGKSN